MSMDFRTGSYLYASKFYTMPNTQIDDSLPEFVAEIEPGGWLRGVRMELRTAVPGSGGGTIRPSKAVGVYIAMASLETIDGDPIIHPMPGDTTMYETYFRQPWLGVPYLRFDQTFSSTAPAFSMLYSNEVRLTAGVLDNTDARSQYRFRFTLNNRAGIYTVNPTVAPTLTVSLYVETWAEPDSHIVTGDKVCATPCGLKVKTVRRRQVVKLAPVNGENTIVMANTGNIIRHITLLTRQADGVLRDAFQDVILRWRYNERVLGDFTFQELKNQVADFYPAVGVAQVSQPIGVMPLPRFYYPGTDYGSGWLYTTNSTYLVFEFITSPTPPWAGTTDAWMEIITDEIAYTDIPPELMNI